MRGKLSLCVLLDVLRKGNSLIRFSSISHSENTNMSSVCDKNRFSPENLRILKIFFSQYLYAYTYTYVYIGCSKIPDVDVQTNILFTSNTPNSKITLLELLRKLLSRP